MQSSLDTINRSIKAHIDTITSIRYLTKEIEALASKLIDTLKKGGTIYWCGNGGSAADCQHLAAELVGRFNKERPPLKSIALTTDTSAITCISNDYSFDEIFSRQVQGLCTSNDFLIGISTSGNSLNVFKAFETAIRLGVSCAGLLGKDGGMVRGLPIDSITISSNETARVQEAHILIGHILCDIIDNSIDF